MRKFLLIFAMMLCGNLAYATDTNTPACIAAIGNDQNAFVNVLKSEILKGKEFNQQFVDQKKDELYTLIARNLAVHCLDVTNLDDFNTNIADADILTIPFQMDGKYYSLNINVAKLFDYTTDYLKAGIMVTTLSNPTLAGKHMGDVITKSEMPTDYFFSGQCSDHWVRVNIDDNVAINKAGQAAFPTFAGSNEFFIDFPIGKNNRAFPGLIIASAKGIGGSEQVVWFTNYKNARASARKFAAALQNTPCANDRLAVNVVALNTVPTVQNGKSRWALGGGITGGAAIGVGAFLASNPVGWIIAGVAAAGAAVGYAILPESLANMEQVMVLDGPYQIR